MVTKMLSEAGTTMLESLLSPGPTCTLSWTLTEWVPATPEAIFRVVSDPRRRPEWQSSLRQVFLLTDGAPGLGTRWREVTKSGLRFELEISAFEAPRYWAEQGQSRLVTGELGVRFNPERGGTTLAVEVRLTLQGALRALAPVLRWVLTPVLKSDLRRAGRLASN